MTVKIDNTEPNVFPVIETVDSAISKPSLSSSPWIRGAPHNGFSLLIRTLWLQGRPFDRRGSGKPLSSTDRPFAPAPV
jgi:hypothetical protein